MIAGSVGFAVWSALLPSNASDGARVAVAGVIGGGLIVGLLVLMVLVATAPIRQRNDLRRQIEQRADEATQQAEHAKANAQLNRMGPTVRVG